MLIRGLQNLESSFGKVLILFVRSRHCGELNRGLQNLGAPCKGMDCHFLHCAKSNQKAHGAKPCDPRFKALPEVILQKFSRHVSKPVFPAKRRRKGFESVRKDSCRADARLRFFEKGLLYCKLTVASDIRKGLLHVSFGAVRNCCRCALRKSFSLSVSFA